MFGQVIVVRLHQDYGILTQISGNNFIVPKWAPLVVSEEQVNHLSMPRRAWWKQYIRRHRSGQKPWDLPRA
jgi:hypothetical protein